MINERQTRFDMKALRDLAGAEALARGQAGNRDARCRSSRSTRAASWRGWTTRTTITPNSQGKEALARAGEPTHPREALEIYAERVEQLVESGGNPAYTEAAALITRRAALRDVAEQTTDVATLKARFGRRRHVVTLLA